MDLEHRPKDKIFRRQTNADNNGDTDVHLLAERQKRISTASATPTVSLSLVGPASEVEQLRGLSSTPAVSVQPANAPTAPTPQPPTLQPKMTLANWCIKFTLSDNIRDKLDAHDVSGPHALRFLTDRDLLTEFGLSLGQLGDIRDAHERWLAGIE